MRPKKPDQETVTNAPEMLLPFRLTLRQRAVLATLTKCTSSACSICFRRPQKNLSNLRKSMRKVVFALISLSYIISLVFAIQTGAAHAAVPAAGKADAGAASFKRYCAGCHSVDPEHKLMGPTLCSEMRGLHRKTTKDVRDIIVQGNGHMPRFGSLLSEQELTDLLAYIRTL
jgi:mono/diheme cytochrome c family protein